MNHNDRTLDWQDNMVRQFLNPPNWFTAASMFCGMNAIILAMGTDGEPDFYRAGLMVLFAGVFDTIDGGVARLTKTGSDFGIQLDSLVDVVSFGIAPAFLLYAWGASTLGTFGLFAAFFYALCATFRLARFNTKADGSKSAWSEGLTVTMSGGAVASVVMAHAQLGGGVIERPYGAVFVAVLLGVLMVSSVPYRGWKTFRTPHMIGLAITLGLTLVLAVRYDISWAFFFASIIYTAMGPVEAALTRRWRVADYENLQVASASSVDD
jgi:CDP-diacylglycerol--serine O-phosphatidyltransferase